MELEKNTLVDLFLIPLAGGVHPKFWQKKTRKPSGHKNNKTFAKSMEEHRTQLSDCRISLECPLRVLSPFGTHHSPVFPPTKKRPVHDFPPDSPRNTGSFDHQKEPLSSSIGTLWYLRRCQRLQVNEGGKVKKQMTSREKKCANSKILGWNRNFTHLLPPTQNQNYRSTTDYIQPQNLTQLAPEHLP